MCVCLETWSSVLFTFSGDYSKWSLDSSCEKKNLGGKIVTKSHRWNSGRDSFVVPLAF